MAHPHNSSIMTRPKYNGWSNYATWRFNLEFVQDSPGTAFADDWERLETAEQVERLKEAAHDFIDNATMDEIVQGWVEAFLDDVDFWEVVKHINED